MDQDKPSSARRTERDTTSPAPVRRAAAKPPVALFVEPAVPAKREPGQAVAASPVSDSNSNHSASPADVRDPKPSAIPVKPREPKPTATKSQEPKPAVAPAKSKKSGSTAPAARQQDSKSIAALTTTQDPAPGSIPAQPKRIKKTSSDTAASAPALEAPTAAVKAVPKKAPAKKASPKTAGHEEITKAPAVAEASPKKASAHTPGKKVPGKKAAAASKAKPEPVPAPEQLTIEVLPPEPPEPLPPELLPPELLAVSTVTPTRFEAWSAVWWRPQLLPVAAALAMVDRYAPSAQVQADWLHRTYPNVPPDRLTRVAVRTAVRRARLATGTAIVGGPLGAAAALSALVWIHSRLVLDIAAIYRTDPAAPERAADILVLLRIRADRASAARAVAAIVDGTAKPDPEEPGHARLAWRARRVTAAGTRVATRLAASRVPGAGLVLDALRTATQTEDLARRAERFYRDTTATR